MLSLASRGVALAVNMARSYGLRKLGMASTGNAGAALAAYAAVAGLEAHIFLPRDVPQTAYVEAVACGASVEVVNGTIADCTRIVAERKQAKGWFDVSRGQEPFRTEGEKTLGYEIVEQLGWRFPHTVICPGGAGLIALWKAFAEMEALGWVLPGGRPKLVAVNANHALVQESGGMTVASDEHQTLASLFDWARHEGVLLSPQAAAGVAAHAQLLATGWLSAADQVVLIDPAAGQRYVGDIARAMQLPPTNRKLPGRYPVGGIITPQ